MTTRDSPALGEAPSSGTKNQPRKAKFRITNLFRRAVVELVKRVKKWILRIFRRTVAEIMGRTATPAPTRKSPGKRGKGEKDRQRSSRKHLVRVFRKTGRQVSEDRRDNPPTFDSEHWRRHEQSVSDYILNIEEACEPMRPYEPDFEYASPDL